MTGIGTHYCGDGCQPPHEDEGQRITDAINADPAEAALLERSRRAAAAGLAWALKDAAENFAASDLPNVTETRPLGAVPAAPSRTGPGAGEETGRTLRTVSGPPLGVPAEEVPGRLDRILAEQAKAEHFMTRGPADWARERIASYACCGAPSLCGATCQDDEQSVLFGWANRFIAEAYTERDQARAGMAALEAECAALAAALDRATHPYDPPHPSSPDQSCWTCGNPDPQHPVHRTSERVRAELGHGAT